jgi:hypothetical protein
MSTLNDRDRHLLNDLERQLKQEDPAWIRQFNDPKAPRHLRLATAMGLLMLLAALCLLLGIPVGAVIFGCAVIVLAYMRYRR